MTLLRRMAKKQLILFFLLIGLCLPVMAGIHSYTSNSVLSDGRWVKIRVSESGVCRMSFSELSNVGLDPQQLRVFGYGGAQLAQDFTPAQLMPLSDKATSSSSKSLGKATLNSFK